MLILKVVATKAKIDIFKVRQENNEEFESWVHREFSKENRTRCECKTEADFSNLKFFQVNFLLIVLGFT